MAKIYIEDIKLTAIRNKLFASLSDEEQVNIFDAIVLSSGDYLPTQKMIDGKYSVYGGGGITDKKHNDFNIEFETLGIGRVGARCGCVFKIKPQSWITDNALFASKIDNQFDLEFLVYFLNFKNLNQYANTAAQPVISLKRISGISIPKIDLRLQKEIVVILNNVEKGLIEIENDKFGIGETLNFISSKEGLDAELTHQQVILKQLHQSFLNEAMQGKLVKQEKKEGNGSDLLKKIKSEKEKLIAEKRIRKEKEILPIKEEEVPFDIPDNWVWCRFQEITKLITCGMASTPKYYPSGKIFLSAKNVKPFRFIPEEHKFVDEETYRKITQNAKPEFQDILITRVGAGIGETALIDREIDFAFYVSLTLVKPMKEFIDPMFLTMFLNSPQGISNAVSFTTGVKSSQGNLNVDKVRKFLIPLPPLAEQKRIVKKLEEVMKVCEELKTTITDNQNYTDQLLQVALKDALQMKEVEVAT